MKLYKLTDEKGQTYNNTQWGEGVTHTASGEGKMCGPGWLHAYISPLLAVLMNPEHADFQNPILWDAEGEIGITDGTKIGTTRLTTIRQIPLPTVTTEQRVRFAILCAREVYDDKHFMAWAKAWLSGADRTNAAAYAAYAAHAAANAAAHAAYANVKINFNRLAEKACEAKDKRLPTPTSTTGWRKTQRRTLERSLTWKQNT